MTYGVHLSVGRGMGLYLCIALVFLKGILRRMFLYFYNSHDRLMLTLHVDDIYDVNLTYEHVIGL